MTLVKICGITNLKDALIAVDAGALALGFNFCSLSSRYIEPDSARAIIDQLPSHMLSVGVFVNEPTPEAVARIADEAGIGAVQLHGDESPAYCLSLKDRYVIKALRMDSGFSPERAMKYDTQAILLDAFSTKSYGGTGQIVDWSKAKETSQLVPRVFLAGGLSHENVAQAIAIVRPFAVDACSCLESTPGIKDASRVRAFVAAAITPC